MNLFHYIKTLFKDKVQSTKYLGAFGSVPHTSYSVLCTLAILAMTACSQDAVDVDYPDVIESQDDYYITINLLVPSQTGTRSSTTDTGASVDGEQPATSIESTLRSAEFYLCVDNEPKLKLETESLVGQTNGTISYTVKLSNLNKLVELAEDDIQVFVVGNPTEAGISSHDFGDTAGKKDADEAKFSVSAIGSAPLLDFDTNGQLMPLVNAKVFKLPVKKGATAEELLALFQRGQGQALYYMVPGQIELERAVGRLEYKDQDRPSADLPIEAPHTYKIGNLSVNLELNTLTPFNVNKESYLFRHTAPGTFAAAGSTVNLFGIENGGNDAYTWVASPWWTSNTPSFLNKLTVSSDSYSIAGGNGSINIATLDARVIDGDDYHPWCYVSENTLSSTQQMLFDASQTSNAVKYATGVAFKFIVLDEDGEPLQYEDNPGGDDSKYPSEVSNSVSPEMPSGGKWITITDPSTQKWVDAKPESVKYGNETIEAYTLTYIACIVHNDGNVKDEETGIAPMYYGVVRNNTYQMSVKSIAGLPLPQEPRTLFLELDCKVLDWNVRKDPGITLY